MNASRNITSVYFRSSKEIIFPQLIGMNITFEYIFSTHDSFIWNNNLLCIQVLLYSIKLGLGFINIYFNRCITSYKRLNIRIIKYSIYCRQIMRCSLDSDFSALLLAHPGKDEIRQTIKERFKEKAQEVGLNLSINNFAGTFSIGSFGWSHIQRMLRDSLNFGMPEREIHKPTANRGRVMDCEWNLNWLIKKYFI